MHEFLYLMQSRVVIFDSVTVTGDSLSTVSLTRAIRIYMTHNLIEIALTKSKSKSASVSFSSRES